MPHSADWNLIVPDMLMALEVQTEMISHKQRWTIQLTLTQPDGVLQRYRGVGPSHLFERQRRPMLLALIICLLCLCSTADAQFHSKPSGTAEKTCLLPASIAECRDLESTLRVNGVSRSCDELGEHCDHYMIKANCPKTTP